MTPKTRTLPAAKAVKTQTNVLLGAPARAALKALALTMVPQIKLSEANVIEILLIEEAKRRSITLPK
jgi:hypothetical protein